MSKYRLSSSSPLGLGCVVSTGIVMPSSVTIGVCSITGEMILGYLLDSHLKAAGIPMLGRVNLAREQKSVGAVGIRVMNNYPKERETRLRAVDVSNSARETVGCAKNATILSPGDRLEDCDSEEIARTGKRLC